MPVVLSDLVTEVDSYLNRGDLYDANIKDELRRAVRQLERKYDFAYMHDRSQSISVVADTRAYAWGITPTIKKLNYAWREDADGKTIKIPVIEQPQLWQTEAAYPQGLIINGRTGIVFDNTPSTAFTLYLDLFLFSTWSDDDASEHWLFDNADEVLIHQAIKRLAVRDDDDELFQKHQALEAEALDLLIEADLIYTDFGGSHDSVMLYEG